MRVAAIALGCLLLFVPQVHARKQADFAYPVSLVWTAAVRLMRVEMESPIREKDREEGYFLFDYSQGGRVHVGSVEVLVAQTKQGPVARVVVQLAGLPSYVEAMMLTRLQRKLTKEYGPPRQRQKLEKDVEKPKEAPVQEDESELDSHAPAAKDADESLHQDSAPSR